MATIDLSNLIYDRTSEDVTYAVYYRKNGDFANHEDVMERGMLTVNCLNRIESTQTKIANAMLELSYSCGALKTKEWKHGDYFKQSDFERLCENNTKLKNAFYAYSTTPEKAEAKLTYSQINNLEKMLYDIGEIINYLNENALRCGTFEAGEYY